MLQVKRIEIIVDALEIPNVVRRLEAAGVSGYTIIKDATGMGERGLRDAGELTDVFKNSYLLTTCLPEQIERIVEAIRPILKLRGGVCLVSDAQWVIH
jgi:nitrogen regulatory protein PII